MPRTPEAVRIRTYERPASVGHLVTIEPDKPWLAYACKGKPDKVKVVKGAYAYGKTEAEALAALAVAMA